MRFINGHNLVFRTFANHVHLSVPVREEESQVETWKIYNLQEKDLRKQSYKINLDF